MPKPAHVKVTFEGVIGTAAAPVERWAFGVNFPADAIPVDGTQAVDDAIATSIKAKYLEHLAGRMPTDTILTRVTTARIDATGHYAHRADGSYVKGEWNGSVPGTGIVNAIPIQTALCVSLKTNRAGATGKGRFFLPFPSKPIQISTKRLNDADTSDMCLAAKWLLHDLGVIMTYAPQVVSTKGYMSEVVGVRVGHAPDTMRSRREDLPEVYIDLPLA